MISPHYRLGQHAVDCKLKTLRPIHPKPACATETRSACAAILAARFSASRCGRMGEGGKVGARLVWAELCPYLPTLENKKYFIYVS